MNLYEWLNTPDSLFFSPGIARYLHRLQRKLYGLLISKLRSLGAEIVQASFTQVILNTKKTQGGQAVAYCEFLQHIQLIPKQFWARLESLLDTPCFKHIQLIPKQLWARLVFMDRYNFAGLEEMELGSDELEEERNIQKAIRPAHDLLDDGLSWEEERNIQKAIRPVHDLLDDGLVLRQQWDIAEHLPRRFRRLVNDLIADFVCLPMQYRKELMPTGATPGKGGGVQPSPGLTQKRKTLANPPYDGWLKGVWGVWSAPGR
ncbi:hypothetical protein T484DRAFT_1788264 [Baffinella frigidus]|nr:hypothetical protein T484DRAFT_1788264 [Cryptophyta sp. CCMP2293]